MQTPSKIFLATVVLILVNLGFGAYFLFHKPAEAGPEITTPVLAIETLRSHCLYFTPQARACLLEYTPQMLAPGDRDEKSERSVSFAQAAQDPVLWRQLDRKYRFDSILLCGDPATYRPLLRHLIDRGDWTLTYVDHTSLIFQRPPATPWVPSNLDALRKKFESRTAEERVAFLVQLAGRLSGVMQLTLAKHCLDDALKLNPNSPDALTQLALYYTHFGQWKQALEKADAALAVNKNYRPALVIRAQGLLYMRKFDDALKVSDRLMELAPNDPEILFLHAKVAHEAHAYSREIAALQVLIDQAEHRNQSTTGLHIFLGQAYAASGDAVSSLQQFQTALAAGDLSREQKKELEECVGRIKSRM